MVVGRAAVSCVGRCGVSTPRTSRPCPMGDRVVVVGMLKQRSWRTTRREAPPSRWTSRRSAPAFYAEAKPVINLGGRERRHLPAGVWQVPPRPVGDGVPPAGAAAAVTQTPF